MVAAGRVTSRLWLVDEGDESSFYETFTLALQPLYQHCIYNMLLRYPFVLVYSPEWYDMTKETTGFQAYKLPDSAPFAANRAPDGAVGGPLPEGSTLPQFVVKRLQEVQAVLPALNAPLPRPMTPVAAPKPMAATPRQPFAWRWVASKTLLATEMGALAGFLVLLAAFGLMVGQLNKEAAQFQQQRVRELPALFPTPQPSRRPFPLSMGVNASIWPAAGSGYLEPYPNGEPDNLPVPVPSQVIKPDLIQQARRIRIPALNLDKPIVQGDSWDDLKKGVGQYISSALPGKPGNVVLSAHNDIYGQIFRHLDKLATGDEIIISTESRSYIYIVQEVMLVDPTAVWVMEPSGEATTTLISCYPYLINNKRIVIKADLLFDTVTLD